jgi:SH3-like domain-containing protein
MEHINQRTQAAVICLIIFICISYTDNSLAAKGDKLKVIGDIVNLRAGPSTSADLLIKLLKDRKVIEIQRQDDWIEIETHRKDIKTGWVHQSLLGKVATKSPNTSSPTRFDRFKQRFDDQNQVIKMQNGVIYFSTVKNKGQGQIDVIATEAWLNSQREKRGATMNAIFKLWSNVVPVGSSMSVRVFDEHGEQHMVMVR